jgi:hypothetical protein
MAKEGGKSEIGGVSVGITGDNSPLKQSLNEAKADVNQFASQAEASTGKVTSSFTRLGDSVKGATRPFTSLISAMGSVVAKGSIVIGTIGGIAAAVVALSRRINELELASKRSAAAAIEMARDTEKAFARFASGSGDADLDSVLKDEADALELYMKRLNEIEAARKAGTLTREDAARQYQLAYEQHKRAEDAINDRYDERRAQKILQREYDAEMNRLEWRERGEEQLRREAEDAEVVLQQIRDMDDRKRRDNIASAWDIAKSAQRELMTEEERLMDDFRERAQLVRALRAEGSPESESAAKALEEAMGRAFSAGITKMETAVRRAVEAGMRNAFRQQQAVWGGQNVTTAINALGQKLDTINRAMPRGPFGTQ